MRVRMGGNQRFKLSDMMPNAWFYKLRDMSKVKVARKMQVQAANSAPNLNIKNNHPFFYSKTNSNSNSKFSYTDPPRKSTKKRKTVYLPSPTPSPDPPHTMMMMMNMNMEEDLSESYLSTTDIIIDLPPIHTARNSFSAGRGLKLRHKNKKKPQPRRRPRPRPEEKKKGRMFYSESFAIVKASFDPEKDFEESMMEMIVENNITDSTDLEDLLACYLSLNSNQYHPAIIKAFHQIWFKMPQHHF